VSVVVELKRLQRLGINPEMLIKMLDRGKAEMLIKMLDRGKAALPPIS
jgi:hypothetical protein